MDSYVDATTLIALGNVGELELLTNFEGRSVVLDAVRREVTSSSASVEIDRLLGQNSVTKATHKGAHIPSAADLLGDDELNGDVAIVTAILRAKERNESVAVVSDDRRVRTVAESLGATVTGTIGVVVRAVHEGMPPDEAKELVRRLDSQGLHMTGELRETTNRLVDEAAKEREE
jgi:predicted nucleic acid-binding protein